MAVAAETYARLRETDGFVVESADGDLGWVEEVWLGETNEPRALAVRTAEGQHGLLLGEDVVAVDRENRWVVVAPERALLELDSPRLTNGTAGGGAALAARWGTTGKRLSVVPRPRRLWHVPYRPSEPRSPAPAIEVERPVWQGIAILLATIALLVSVTIAVAFLVAYLVTGGAY